MPSTHLVARVVTGSVAILLLCAACDRAPAPAVDPLGARANVALPPEIARGDIQFVDDYESALAISRNQNKPLMLFFTAGWCRYCNLMAQEAFRQGPVVTLSQRFVCVLVDADRQVDLCRKFQVRMFPTIIFVAGDAAPLRRVMGKQPCHRLVMEMQSALQSVARRDDWSSETFLR